MENKKVKIKKQNEQPKHPLYRTFQDAKSVAIELARQIAETSKELPPDVQFIIDIYGKKAA